MAIRQRIKMERTLRHLQTFLVLAVMAALFGVTGFALLGPSGLAILVGGSFLMLMMVGGREVRVDTSQAAPVSRDADPRLYDLLHHLTRKAGLDQEPRPFLIPTREMNAATMDVGAQPILAITRPMLTHLSERELRGVLAHEVVHLAQHDTAYMKLVMMLQLLTITVARIGWLMLILFWPLTLAGDGRISPLVPVLLIGAPVISVLLQAALSRSREYAADLGAVELTGDPEGLASALEKIDHRRRRLWRQVLPVPQKQRTEGSIFRTHPAQKQRVGRLRKLAAEMHPANGG